MEQTQERYLIWNPVSGTPSRQEEFRALVDQLNCSVMQTTEQRGAEEIARDLLEQSPEKIVVAGGDGTVRQVVSALQEHSSTIPLGIIPLGTGNDFYRSLCEDLDLQVAIQRALGEQTSCVDLIHVRGEQGSLLCTNMFSLGFGGQIAESMEVQEKSNWGKWAYLYRCLSKSLEAETFQLQLTLDGQTFLFDHVLNLFVANGRCVAGGWNIVPPH
ncbi:MAG: diacylglycerol kinase family protein, partial [Myxococcota bacterium]